MRDRLARQLTELANERTLMSLSRPLDASTKSKAGFRVRSPVWQDRAEGSMKMSWILRVATVGFVSGLLLGTAALGQAESKAKSGDVARGKTLFARYCASCHGPQG